jgi:proline iminopeptidase
MSQFTWKEQILPISDGQLAFFEAGNGPTVLFLAGGPGDDHGYLRVLAEPLTQQIHCILLDQRGTGRSFLKRMDETTLHISRFLEDIEAIRIFLGQARLQLIGHSWGAMLALLYSVTYPEHVERAALLGLGPCSDEMSTVAKANYLKPLSKAEREEYAALSAQRKAAFDGGNFQAYKDIHIRIVTEFSVKSWFYSPEVAERFKQMYRSTYSYNPAVGKYLLPTVKRVQIWERLHMVTAPMLILYGYQDFEPITQAYLLHAHLPEAQLCFINECGHVPWLEQPEQCHQALVTFFQES